MWGRAVVAYQAHNLMVVGSSPTPATNKLDFIYYEEELTKSNGE